MALATRCPHCQTTFRVANDQLKLHAGLVRCGSCQQAFNGVEHLIPLDGSKIITPATSSISGARRPIPAQEEKSEALADVTVGSSDDTTQTESTVPQETISEDIFSIIPTDDHPDPASWQKNDLPSDVAEEQAPPVTDAPVALAEAEAEAESLPDSAASLDFLLGDEEIAPALDGVTPDAALAAAVELETKAATLAPADDAWSVSDSHDNLDDLADVPLPSGPESEGDHRTSGDGLDEAREPYISEEESPLAQQAALAEDSVSDPTTDASGEATGEPKPDFVLKAEREQKRGRLIRIAMVVAILLLLPLLLLQATYLFRVQIAANFPESKASLIQACGVIHCQIDLPAQIERISVESNELESLPPDNKAFSLAMQLQNNSSTLQAWPYVELVLNDEKERAVLQKAFKPSEYLVDPAVISKGFASKSQQNIKLYFELPKTKASGYHVSIFYP